jgi:hypothetical protein
MRKRVWGQNIFDFATHNNLAEIHRLRDRALVRRILDGRLEIIRVALQEDIVKYFDDRVGVAVAAEGRERDVGHRGHQRRRELQVCGEEILEKARLVGWGNFSRGDLKDGTEKESMRVEERDREEWTGLNIPERNRATGEREKQKNRDKNQALFTPTRLIRPHGVLRVEQNRIVEYQLNVGVELADARVLPGVQLLEHARDPHGRGHHRLVGGKGEPRVRVKGARHEGLLEQRAQHVARHVVAREHARQSFRSSVVWLSRIGVYHLDLASDSSCRHFSVTPVKGLVLVPLLLLTRRCTRPPPHWHSGSSARAVGALVKVDGGSGASGRRFAFGGSKIVRTY